MGLAIAMFSLCAGRARELSSRYVYGNGRNVAWETRNGISRTWSVGEDKLKTFRRQKHHPLTVRYETQTWCTWCWLPESHDRFMLGICVANASSPDVHWEVWSGRICCRVYHCCRHTMVSKFKLDHNEVPRPFARRIEGAFCQSLFEHTQTTHPFRFKFTLRSLTQVTVLHFVLRLSFYQTHDFFKKCLQSLIRQRFFCFVIFLAHEILQNPIVLGRKMKNFPGGTAPGPPSFFRHHTNNPTSYATARWSNPSPQRVPAYQHCWSMDRTICLPCSPMCETRSSVYVVCETRMASSPPSHQRTEEFLSSVPGEQSCWSCIFFEPCSTSLELFTCWHSGSTITGFWTFWKNHAF